MQFNKIMRILIYLFMMLFIQTNLKAEIIKFSSCEYTKHYISEVIHEISNKKKETKIPYNEKEAMAKENDSMEYRDRTFDTETKIQTLQYKSKGEKEKEKVEKSNFEIRDKDTFTFVELVDIAGRLNVNVYFFYLSEGIVEQYEYSQSNKKLIMQDKCKSNYSSPDSSDSQKTVSGSAFFINSKGYLLTNNHVVKGCKLQKIKYKGKDYDANILATDKSLDLALMKVDVRPKSYLSFSKSSPEKLQKIYVAGYPFGKGLSDDLKISSGIVSSVKGYDDNSNEFQVDAPINPGNSGGPIVDDTGELIGIAVAGLAKDKSEGINFGIKSLSAVTFLKTNKIDPETSYMTFGMNNKKLLQLLEETTVYTYCN